MSRIDPRLSRASRILVAGLFLASNFIAIDSQAASVPISVQSLSLISKVDASETPLGMLVKRKDIFLYGTISGFATTDGFVQAVDENGQEKWKIALDSGGNDIVTAGAIDPFGNIWIAGSSAASLAEGEATPSPVPTVLNPDSVTVVTEPPTRNDPNFITMWEISPSGNLLFTYSTNLKRAVFVKAISVNSTVVTLAGIVSTTMGSAGFLIQSDRHGQFGKLNIIGKSDTEINAIAKVGKNLVLVGSSGEELFAKQVNGVRDGIILTYSSSGKFLTMVRSFNDRSSRVWRSATGRFFLGGSGKTDVKSEAVVTKYSTAVVPIWSARFMAQGAAQTIDISSSMSAAVFSSTSSIVGVKSWKPTHAQLIALIFDSKGGITRAFRASSVTKPIASAFSAELGLVVLGQSPVGVSIFHSVTL